jgi:hypothetical protein
MVAGVLAAATGLGACGGGDDDGPRKGVEAYIKRANAIQRGFAPEFKRANAAYVGFSRSGAAGDDAIAALERAGADVRRARAELARLQPPSQARRLHALLLRVFGMNVYFADETARLAAYQRDSQTATAPLRAVDARLRRELGAARTPERQERALQRFVRGIDGALGELEALRAPRVLRPQHEAQVTQLHSTRSLAAKLRRALRAQQAERVARLVKAFRRGGGDGGASEALTRRALSDYNRRYAQLQEANADLQREQARLDERLG